jgi:histidinol-phosphate aminotransferase
LAEQCRVELNQVTLGNGSNDILELVARAYLAPGLNAVFSEHAFAVYPIATQAVGAQAKVVPAKDWGHDLPAMLAAIDANTRVVFIANPNNPTGTWFGAEALDEFLQDVPEHVLVVLDEAYIEYAGRQRPAGRPDSWRRTRICWYRGRSPRPMAWQRCALVMACPLR